MVLLTTGFGEFKFPPTFSLLLLLDNKNAGKFKLKVAKCQKVREIQNCETVKKFGKIPIPQIL